MARAREYKRSLDAMNTNTDFTDIPRFSEEEILIKQEPCDKDDTDSYDTYIPTVKESEDIKLSNIPEDNISWKENVYSQSESLCNITTNQIEEKPFLMSHVETEDRKYIQQEKDSFVIDKNGKNRKRLVKHNDIKTSSKKQGRDISATMGKKSIVYCEICSLPYDSLNRLKFHKSSYTRNSNYFCSSCFSHSCSHMRLKISNKMSKSSRYRCHFCKRLFSKKKKLQGHLFHVHGKEIGINVEGDSFSIKHSATVSYSGVLRKKRMRQKTMMEYIVRPNEEDAKNTSENLNNSNDSSALTIIKQEVEWMDDQVNDQSSTDKIVSTISRTSQELNENKIRDQPFVKIHVDSNMMKALLGISNGDDCLEQSFLYSSNINSDSITNSSNSKPYALRSLNNSITVNNSKPSMIVRENNRSGSKVRRLLSMCKKCTILLVRYDDKLLTRLTSNSSKFTTSSSQVLKPVKRKLRKRRLPHRKSKNNELSSKNRFPLINVTNKSSVRSPPVKIRKRIAKSKANLSIALNFKRSTEFKQTRKKRSDPPRSLLKRFLLDLRKNESSKKANITNRKNSSSRKKSVSTEFQNKRSANAIAGLKEVKVSLVKLPEIKKELIVPEVDENATIGSRDETFPCTICKTSLISEKRLKKHMKKYHTAYISSICRARYASKRLLLKHYLQEHDMWVCKCCVCYQFFNSRLSLKRHLLLHCIKITLSKYDRPLSSKTIKCHLNTKRYKCKRSALKIMLQSQSTERREIDVINRKKPKENLNISRIENLTNQVSESKENNDDVLGKVYDRLGHQTVFVEITSPFKSNNTEVSPSRSNDLMEEPILDASYTANESIIYNSNEYGQIELIPHTNVIQSGVSDNNQSGPNIETIVNNRKYPCSVCGKQFQKQGSLFKHQRTYARSYNNFCEICGLLFSSKNLLKTHINTTHDPLICNLYKLHCQFCNQGFRSENNLRIHELHYHATAVTINNQRVTDFLKVSNGDTNQSLQTICNICGLFFNTYERYQLHYTYYYENHIFSCIFCNKIFHGWYMLHRHNKLYHFRNSSIFYEYKCSICYEGFTIKSHFQAHQSHVHSNKEHMESSISNFTLNSLHYNKMSKSYICSKCNVEFFNIAELMLHVEHFSNRGNYQCLDCPRKCYTLSILCEHISLNHDDNGSVNGHKCDICGEILISSISLLCHRKHLHSEGGTEQVVSFSCKYSNTSVNINEIIHDDKMVIDNEPMVIVHNPTSSINLEKCNISCPICAVNFEKEVCLKEHLAEYLDFGDYQCGECKRRFANSEFLRKHVENHVAPGMSFSEYYCTVCNENFKSSDLLESHVAHLHARVIFKDVSSKPI
ncbi:hypothetical protein HZH66_012442 [Vespula vulgaris]|uniref:C2H2-type domain-containing protein n=2 Tax=Vespula vulgaris TaxID=7454 RepID=A0A834JBK9_VESVU|nr:uncharacterized protein LOC127069698 isoform X1 [Vespula vulgaris]KAF7384192.1 hypothetical protein HZH66_012442 [Vespula vulgaris]